MKVVIFKGEAFGPFSDEEANGWAASLRQVTSDVSTMPVTDKPPTKFSATFGYVRTFVIEEFLPPFGEEPVIVRLVGDDPYRSFILTRVQQLTDDNDEVSWRFWGKRRSLTDWEYLITTDCSHLEVVDPSHTPGLLSGF
jgi:hypothetical protein